MIHVQWYVLEWNIQRGVDPKINIESVFQDIVKSNSYKPYEGIVLTDTFQLYEQDRDMIADLLPDNSKRRTNQKKRKITIIIGNPPYSIGQASENDNAAKNWLQLTCSTNSLWAKSIWQSVFWVNTNNSDIPCGVDKCEDSNTGHWRPDWTPHLTGQKIKSDTI